MDTTIGINKCMLFLLYKALILNLNFEEQSQINSRVRRLRQDSWHKALILWSQSIQQQKNKNNINWTLSSRKITTYLFKGSNILIYCTRSLFKYLKLPSQSYFSILSWLSKVSAKHSQTCFNVSRPVTKDKASSLVVPVSMF